MALPLRQAVGRPLGAAVRASSCSHHARIIARSFVSTTLRAKEVAGQSSETPNMRVRCLVLAITEETLELTKHTVRSTR